MQALHVEEISADAEQAPDAAAATSSVAPAIDEHDAKESKARLMAGWLVFAPDSVSRLAELRLWASQRTEDQVTDLMDTHLDLADTRRKKLDVQIHPKDCKCLKCSMRNKAADAAISGGAGLLNPTGGLLSGGGLAGPPAGARRGLLGAPTAAAGGLLGAPPPAATNKKLAAMRASTVPTSPE
jgi:hypothetical protein